MRVLVHAPGPAGHGVVRHARTVASLTAPHLPGDGPQLAHAQFTDALYGPDIATAASAFETWAAAAPRPLVVTLHDLPGGDPDPARDRRRLAGYARVAAACDAVVVSSTHEAERAALLGGPPATVIPLPLAGPSGAASGPGWDRPTIGVLGYVYPGKGHAEALDAAARAPGRPRVVAAGAASPGHDDLVRDLHRRADRLGVELHVTGPLTDPALAHVIEQVDVPLFASRAVSASASLLTWLACGRRPVTAAGRFADEVGALAPGSLLRYADEDELDRVLAAALDDPACTRADGPPDWPDAGRAHAELYAKLTTC